MKNNKNIIWHNHKIKRRDRENNHGHLSKVLWFTGLSGSGKSTIAGMLERIFFKKKLSTYLLDGDNIRYGLCRDLSFDKKDRKENIRRVGEIAKIMMDAGIIVFVALISPYREDRESVKILFKKNEFIEIFVDTPLSVCQKRDVKGLYKFVQLKKINNFTGINDDYEKPLSPDIWLDGTKSLINTMRDLLKNLRRYNLV
ncbi:adenylyl-sulfate kinase [Candidatus Tachikawaea gelatinosa]|uniref:Adenylyl-sulfate kinase n=1 Tax=Candidatus Tachikawaea gelatinosa TaxID=1410383 RepID=A0A090AJB9_9ENTR|nr:adenylyl-sulfate kinase [Candidatus Tachikawaea gelatinosa]BAP58538.1 adenylyl-sulfate kinase [Candidatus Tachikawaea gelatinosa]